MTSLEREFISYFLWQKQIHYCDTSRLQLTLIWRKISCYRVKKDLITEKKRIFQFVQRQKLYKTIKNRIFLIIWNQQGLVLGYYNVASIRLPPCRALMHLRPVLPSYYSLPRPPWIGLLACEGTQENTIEKTTTTWGSEGKDKVL